MNSKIKAYLKSWDKFRLYCENKAKNRCYLNNNAWRKLRDFHLNHYLIEINSPFSFLFMVKYRYNDIYKSVGCMSKYYYRYAKKRRQDLEMKTPLEKFLIIFKGRR